ATPVASVVELGAASEPGPPSAQLTLRFSIGLLSASVTLTQRFVVPPGSRIELTGGENAKLTCVALCGPAVSCTATWFVPPWVWTTRPRSPTITVPSTVTRAARVVGSAPRSICTLRAPSSPLVVSRLVPPPWKVPPCTVRTYSLGSGNSIWPPLATPPGVCAGAVTLAWNDAETFSTDESIVPGKCVSVSTCVPRHRLNPPTAPSSCRSAARRSGSATQSATPSTAAEQADGPPPAEYAARSVSPLRVTSATPCAATSCSVCLGLLGSPDGRSRPSPLELASWTIPPKSRTTCCATSQSSSVSGRAFAVSTAAIAGATVEV